MSVHAQTLPEAFGRKASGQHTKGHQLRTHRLIWRPKKRAIYGVMVVDSKPGLGHGFATRMWVQDLLRSPITIGGCEMKTITMMDLRKRPGEYAHEVYKHGESFLVTNQGRPVFKMVQVEDTTVIRPDGSFSGPKPLVLTKTLRNGGY